MNSANGLSYKEGFEKKFKELGGEIISIDRFEQAQTDYKTIILKLKTKKVQNIFIAGYDREVAAFLKQAKELDYKSNIFASPGIETDEFFELTKGISENVFMCTESVDLKNANTKAKIFSEKYKARTGKEPDFLSLNSYEGLMLIVEAGNKYGFTSEGIKKGLYEIKDYEGVFGKLSFDKNGEIIKDFSVKQVQNGKFVFVS